MHDFFLSEIFCYSSIISSFALKKQFNTLYFKSVKVISQIAIFCVLYYQTPFYVRALQRNSISNQTIMIFNTCLVNCAKQVHVSYNQQMD